MARAASTAPPAAPTPAAAAAASSAERRAGRRSAEAAAGGIDENITPANAARGAKPSRMKPPPSESTTPESAAIKAVAVRVEHQLRVDVDTPAETPEMKAGAGRPSSCQQQSQQSMSSSARAAALSRVRETRSREAARQASELKKEQSIDYLLSHLTSITSSAEATDERKRIAQEAADGWRTAEGEGSRRRGSVAASVCKTPHQSTHQPPPFYSASSSAQLRSPSPHLPTARRPAARRQMDHQAGWHVARRARAS